jgi:seryl-tRNA synthetase
MRKSSDMGGSIRNTEVARMLRKKFGGEVAEIDEYPNLKAERAVLSEELASKEEYKERLKHIEKTEIKREMQEEMSRASSQGDLDLIRRKYTKKLLGNSLKPESEEMQEVLTEISSLKNKLNTVNRKLEYINIEYAEQIKQVEDEKIKAKIREANEIE